MEYKVFTKHNCAWCRKSKDLLSERKLYFEEYIYEEDFTKEQLVQLLGMKPNDKLTLPQIFIVENDKVRHIGGYEALEAHLNEIGTAI